MLRKIDYRKEVDDPLRRRTNEELLQLNQEVVLTDVIRAQRVRWLWYVRRMAGNRTPVGWGLCKRDEDQ